jgi:hypothetical protein
MPPRVLACLLALALAVPFAVDSAAGGQEWRYCLARDEDRGRVMMTGAFLSDEPIESLERRFNAFLDGKGVVHRWGICPRSPSESMAQEDIESAARYSKAQGLAAEGVAWP